MKIALCLFGYPRGSTTYAGGAYLEKFEHLFKQVIKHEPDVFIHSWEPELEQELVSLFNPKKYTFQPQLNFKKEMQELDIQRFEECKHQGGRHNIFKTLSFFYTRKVANDLKTLFEKENNFTYDCVISSRFDVGYHNHGRNQTSFIDFNPKYDMNKVYSAFWPQINAGLSDHWFYGSSKNIDTVCGLYDHALEYLKHDSEYCETMRTGWLDSSESNEFSNELLKTPDERTTALKRYPDYYCLNNHCLYKWHFHTNKLWSNDKCKFLNEEIWKIK